MKRERALYIADRVKDCRHFTGIMGEHHTGRCAAEVLYDDVLTEHDPMQNARGGVSRQSLPCLAAYNPAGADCPKREFPSAEEVGAQYDRDEAITGHTLNAMSTIVKKYAEDKLSRSSIPCPRCGGTLQYRAGAAKGKASVMAKCDTVNCLGFMT